MATVQEQQQQQPECETLEMIELVSSSDVPQPLNENKGKDMSSQTESVTKCCVFWTALGLLLYVADMVTDLGSAVYYAYTGQWWECALTVCIVYLAVLISTLYEWLWYDTPWTGPLGALRYWASLLLNLPDLKDCWRLLDAEWALARDPTRNAHLVDELWINRWRVARLKFTEGLFEACPQAVLQLVLLLPELETDITWTVSMRLMAAAISMCAAGSAPVHMEKEDRATPETALPPGELAVLLVWVVPVTVCRLLCLALLLSVHLYWGLACIALHLALYGVYWCSIEEDPFIKEEFVGLLLNTVLFLVSPFDGSDTHPFFAMRHTIHFVSNAGVTVLWALNTPLRYTQPTLYTALIASIPALFGIGLVGWLLYWIRYGRARFPAYVVLPSFLQVIKLVWAVPVTVCRLLCLALLLSVYLYWGLACMALHLILYCIWYCCAEGVPSTRRNWFHMCFQSVLLLVTPFTDPETRGSTVMCHAIHAVGNLAVVLVFCLYTPPHCLYPELYNYILYTIAAIFVIGLLGWLLLWTCCVWRATSPRDREQEIPAEC